MYFNLSDKIETDTSALHFNKITKLYLITHKFPPFSIPTHQPTAIKLSSGAQVFSLLFHLYHMKAEAFAPKSIADIS